MYECTPLISLTVRILQACRCLVPCRMVHLLQLVVRMLTSQEVMVYLSIGLVSHACNVRRVPDNVWRTSEVSYVVEIGTRIAIMFSLIRTSRRFEPVLHEHIMTHHSLVLLKVMHELRHSLALIEPFLMCHSEWATMDWWVYDSVHQVLMQHLLEMAVSEWSHMMFDIASGDLDSKLTNNNRTVEDLAAVLLNDIARLISWDPEPIATAV